jgi:DNA polymerase I-like protein with 3'-5' exonuclease and polymerase domains
MKLCADVETTTLNKGHVFNPDNQLVSYAYLVPSTDCGFSYFSDPSFLSYAIKYLSKCTEFIGFNCKFDLHWFRRMGIVLQRDALIWDCQLAEFVLNNQRGAFGSLNDALSSYGLQLKHDKVKEYWDAGIDTIDIPVPILEEYNKYDVTSTMELYNLQQSIMTDKQKALVYILGEDMKTLMEAEWNGVKWDADKADQKLEALTTQINTINEELSSYLPSITHGKFNWDSGDHLSALIYGGVITFEYSVSEEAVYKSGSNKGVAYVRNRWHEESVVFPQRFKPLEGTELKKTRENPSATTRFYQTDDPTLSQLKSKDKYSKRLLELLASRAVLGKVSEMIVSINKKRTDLNWTDGMIHAQYNQNVAITGRLSSSNPNMQNTPLEVDELLVTRYAG